MYIYIYVYTRTSSACSLLEAKYHQVRTRIPIKGTYIYIYIWLQLLGTCNWAELVGPGLTLPLSEPVVYGRG